jgi:uncharacterized protein (TIGR02678 family)
MSSVEQALSPTPTPEIEAERRHALRALLRRPLLPATGATSKEYILVRRHSAWLKHWFATYPAWELHIDKEVARLRKAPTNLVDETRPAIDETSGTAFSRRRYALFCLALAALERSEQQTTLGRIAQTIMEFVAADPDLQAAGLVFDIANYDQRRDLVHAVRLLLDYGLLRQIHGDERQFLDKTGAPDVLYDIDRHILAVMLNAPQSPSAVEAALHSVSNAVPRRRLSSNEGRVAGIMSEDPAPAGDDANNSRIRARLVRMLLDDPVLYFQDLNDEERSYLQRQRSYLLRRIQEATGLVPEVRREGIAMVDDTGDLTDISLPEEGTDGHLCLLLADWLANHSRDHPRTAVPVSAIQQHIGNLVRVHGSRWRKAVREPGAEA